jgi:hypothetical protein
MTTIRFREINAKRQVKVPCIACGKVLNRTIKEFQTINPFNVDENGAPKTEIQIYSELPIQLDKAEQKLKQRAICRSCEKLGHRINFNGQHVTPEKT